jgi:hypothetical protein
LLKSEYNLFKMKWGGYSNEKIAENDITKKKNNYLLIELKL